MSPVAKASAAVAVKTEIIVSVSAVRSCAMGRIWTIATFAAHHGPMTWARSAPFSGAEPQSAAAESAFAERNRTP